MKKLKLIILAFFGVTTQIIAQQIPSYVPSNELIGWWPFNGNANDGSINANNGINNGAILTSDRNGNPNSAYTFNGVNSTINCANPSIPQNNSFSISFWIKPTTISGVQEFFCQNYWPSAFYVGMNNGNMRCGDSWQNTNVMINSAQWQHIIIIRNYNNNVQIYKNSLLQSTLGNDIIIGGSPSNPLVFGKQYGGNAEYYNGVLDDIGIWNRALTQQEITSLYQGCTGSVTASITPQGNTTFCAGNSVVLNATSGSGYTYQWSLNGNVINGATLSTISATQQGNYMVNIVAGGCTYPSNSINVNVNALPNVSINGLPNFINYFASPVQVIALPNGGISSGLGYSNGVFTPSIAGLGFKKIQYQYTDNNGCAGSASLSTIVYDTLCANPLGFIKSASNKIDLFPNPVQETITIKGYVPPHSSLEIFDTNGNLVFQELLSSENEQISIRQLKRALYHYRIINAGKILKSASIIKE